MKIKVIVILVSQFFIVGVVYAQVFTTQISTTQSGGNGSGGISDYSIVSKPASGQATIGAEGSGDTWSSMLLGSNISGTRRLWSFSKRTSSENHGLQLSYFNGTSYSSPVVAFSTNGNMGIGTSSPAHLLQIHNSNNPTIAIGQGNLDTNGKSTLSFFAGTSTHQNGFLVQYNKDTSSDRLGFVGGVGVEHLSILNGGKVGIGTIAPQSTLEIRQPDASVYITASNATDGGIGNPSLYINRISEGLKLEYVPNVLARISNTYVGPSGHLAFATAGQDRLFITGNGNIGIGTTDPKGYKLAVAGKAIAEEVVVKLQSNWPDYVFEKNYHLPTLAEVESYINQNKHLPEVPAAKEMEKNGVNLGEMNMLLLKKVEELTLYMIELKKEIEVLKNK